ncbi:MAG: hypothetical protein WHS87_00910 [Anaerolineales bacterium]
MSRFFLLLALLTLFAACAAPSVDGGPLTVTPVTTQSSDHPTIQPSDYATTQPSDHATTRPPTPTPTEAPLTLDTLGIPKEAQPYFQGLEKAITRKVGENGETLYLTSATFWDGEQKQTAEYLLLQPGTFDAHPEIYDDLTRPLTVQAFRLGENGEKLPVTLLWQGERRGFREAFDLTNAFDPELKQVEKHPYLHIVHGEKPIRSIDDLPLEDERLTALQSIRLEQAKAIRALRALREKLQTGEAITLEDLSGSVFLRRLQEKVQAGETITEDDLYVLFSPKALENWSEGGLSLFFELRQDGSKVVYLKSRGDSIQANKKGKLTYENANIKLTDFWFYTKDKQGNRHDMVFIAIMDADDVDRYQKGNPFGLQGKFVLGENSWFSQITPENLILLDLRKAYDEKSPLFPYLYLYAEGPILEKYPRLAHLLSLPDNQANQLEYVDGYLDLQVNIMAFVNDPTLKPGDIAETASLSRPIPRLFQLLELMFEMVVSY